MHKKKYTYFKLGYLVLITILFILPLLLVTNYVFLAADDLCRSLVEPSQYFEKVLHWYKVHNGRFVNALLSYIPIYDLPWYRFVLKVLFILNLLGLFYFIHETLKVFNFKTTKVNSIFLAVVFMVLIAANLPSVYEYFYWYAGASGYQITITAFLFLIPALLKTYMGQNFNFVIVSLLVVTIIGNQEMLILFIDFLLFLLLLKTWKKNMSAKWKVLFLNLVGCAATLLVALLPGSRNRRDNYPEGGDFLQSFFSAFESSIKFMLQELIDWPQILIFIALFLFLFNNKAKEKPIIYINPTYLFIGSVFGMATLYFVPLYATGQIITLGYRVINFIHVVFFILIFVNIVNFSGFLKNKKVHLALWKPASAVLLGIFLLVTALFNKNYTNLYSGFINNEYKQYVHENVIRHESLKNIEEGSEIVLKKRISGPSLFRNKDVGTNPDHWHNQCYTLYINDMNNTQIKSIVNEK